MALKLRASFRKRDGFLLLAIEGEFNMEFGRSYLLHIAPHTYVAVDSGEGFSEEKEGRIEYAVYSEERGREIYESLMQRCRTDKQDVEFAPIAPIHS